jgi:hypothetical protein
VDDALVLMLMRSLKVSLISAQENIDGTPAGQRRRPDFGAKGLKKRAGIRSPVEIKVKHHFVLVVNGTEDPVATYRNAPVRRRPCRKRFHNP